MRVAQLPREFYALQLKRTGKEGKQKKIHLFNFISKPYKLNENMLSMSLRSTT